jgi:small subunit ribosomal protein S13
MEFLEKNKNKILKYVLKNYYGLSLSKILLILSKLKLNQNSLVKDLKKSDSFKLMEILSQWNHLDFVIENKIFFNKKHLKEIKSYRGLRHTLHYPLNGQRTRANAKTVKFLR